jgi:hypothetical protein
MIDKTMYEDLCQYSRPITVTLDVGWVSFNIHLCNSLDVGWVSLNIRIH